MTTNDNLVLFLKLSKYVITKSGHWYAQEDMLTCETGLPTAKQTVLVLVYSVEQKK